MSGEPSDADVGERPLRYLRSELANERLTFAEAPSRVTGGFDTLVYGFRLAGAGDDWSAPLILRLFRAGTAPERARFEATVQNSVAAQGFPAPRAHHTCLDPELLDGPFILMERFPGRIMLDFFFRPSSVFFRLPRILAETQAELHALDAEPLIQALRDSPRRRTIEDDIGQMQRRIDAASLAGLRPGLEWLVSQRPADSEHPVICHGDFHPLNILLERGKVTGVIDWSWVIVADAAYDVGATIAIFTQGPVDLPGFLQGIVNAFRRGMIARYRREYLALRPLVEGAVNYYEALRCLGFLVEAGEYRQAVLGVIGQQAKPSAFTAPRQARSILARFRTLTGVTVALP